MPAHYLVGDKDVHMKEVKDGEKPYISPLIKTEKKPVGRPCEYYPEIVKELLDYFTVELDRKVTKQVLGKMGVEEIKETKAERLPTIEGFCGERNMSKTTLYAWSKIYPELMNALSVAKEKQMNHLIQHALSGDYNGGFAKFLAMNISDYREKHETVNTETNPIKKLIIDMK